MALDTNTLPKMTPEQEQTAADREALARAFSLKNPLLAAGMDIATLPGRGVMGAANTLLRVPRVFGADIPFIPEAAFGGDSASLTPYSDRLRTSAAAAEPTPEVPSPIAAAPITPQVPAADRRFYIPEFATPAAESTRIWGAEQKGIGMGPDPRLSQQLSEARFAAAARGDWDAVNASYGPGGLSGREPDPRTRPPTLVAGGQSTIGELIAHRRAEKAFERGQVREDAQFRNSLLRAQLEQQGANYASEAEGRRATAARQAMLDPAELELRRAQIKEITGQAAERAANQGEYEALLAGKTPAEQQEIRAIKQGIRSRERWTPEKDILGEPTGRFYDAATGVYKEEATRLPAGLVVGASTKQADGSYTVGNKTVTIKNGKVTGIT